MAKNSQAHPGVNPLLPVGNRNVSFQPLPRPLGLPPYHCDLLENFPTIGEAITRDKKLFHVVGDSGGIQDGEFQNNVAGQMIEDMTNGKGAKPQFCYHVGDVVYFTGMRDDYYAQFYEPYAHYDIPILSIPGNHDGEVDDPNVQTSLDGWVQVFHASPSRRRRACKRRATSPAQSSKCLLDLGDTVRDHCRPLHQRARRRVNRFHPAAVGHKRICDRANRSGAHFGPSSPDYSFDVFHSGSSKMADVLENAIRDTGRVPNLVLSGHVHDYQRIEQAIAPGGPTAFIVTGNGGYHNLHAIYSRPDDKAVDTGAVLKYAAANSWGFMTLTVDNSKISGVTVQVDRNGKISKGDSFSYSAKPVVLKSR